MSTTRHARPSDDHVFLVGRPPLGEYLALLLEQTDQQESLNTRVLADEWRLANDHIRDLEEQEAGWADKPSIGAVPGHLDSLVKQVLSDAIFQRSFNIVPAEVALVELDRLIVFQKKINLEYVRELQQRLGPAPTEEDIFRLCLPFDHPNPPFQRLRVANNAFVFVSPSNDLRFLEPTVLDARNVMNYAPPGPISGIVGLVVGFGSNFLNVIHADNRLVLNNGSHRAFALRELGVTNVPCIVQQVTRREELQVIMSGDVVRNPDIYLKAPRPPLLKDYFDQKLRKLLSVPRVLRQVKITFSVEQLDVPAT